MSHVAYGVEPGRRATYELRQSRYHALAEAIAAEVQRIKTTSDRRVRLLDIGCCDGITRKYLQAYPDAESQIDFEGIDLFPQGKSYVYKHEDWKLYEQDLMDGLPDIQSDAYDIVICEQVLEHLPDVQPAISSMSRVLKPGGLMIVGVPIFPEGGHLLRKHLVPILDRAFKVKKVRGHVQAWSLRTFRDEWRSQPHINFHCARGFRIVSGGPLRPLEFTRAWWKLNRLVGSVVPGLCTEVQLIGRKQSQAA
jgi:SAM-dependent methyltransferase